ncbi:MAG: PD-(D/E)XK nuclease family protein, partial [Aquabacterium sp.]
MTPAYTVAVRALCAFTARTGDLDLRFTPAPTALEGMEGHALVAARRGAGWQAERPVSATVGDVRVRGRIDGWDAARLRVEEIKTHKGRLEDQPAHHRALHRAQLHVYGALLCMELGLDELELALVYVDVGTQQETVLLERASAAALQAALHDQVSRFAAWAAQEAAHRQARDAALQQLRFPHGEFRVGQRELAEAVYRAAVRGRCLLRGVAGDYARTSVDVSWRRRFIDPLGQEWTPFAGVRGDLATLQVNTAKYNTPAGATGYGNAAQGSFFNGNSDNY